MSGTDKPKDNEQPVLSVVDADNSSGAEAASGILQLMQKREADREIVTMSVSEWMAGCRDNPEYYENFADRLLKAIGEPEIIDTRKSDTQTRLVYGSKKIKRFKPFQDLYDAEDTISTLVSFIEKGAPGIVVLLGPVGSGKTEIATGLEKLAEDQPVFLLKCKKTGVISPFNDSPLCLLSDDHIAKNASDSLGIPRRYLKVARSAWVTKRLDHVKNGNPDDAFEVVKIYPSREKQLGIAKLDPDDPKVANMASLVGSVDMTKIGEEDPLDPNKTLSAGDPDAYIPGAFSKSNGGLFHAAEFFRNNSAMPNAFLEGVTTGYFTGAGGIGILPMNQLIVVTSNNPVWKEFKAKSTSDAANDRIEVVDVPYTLRMSAEIEIYEKILSGKRQADLPLGPGTLELLAEFAVVSRLKDGKKDALKVFDPHIRARVLNGEIPDGAEKKIPKITELRTKASREEGLEGFSVRSATEKVLSDTFMARASEGIYEADTILLLETLRKFVENTKEEDMTDDERAKCMGIIDNLAERNKKELDKILNAAIIDADDATCQRMFDEYIEYADAWVNETEIHTRSGEPIDLEQVVKFLNEFESRAKIPNGEEFRRSTVAHINGEIARRARANIGKPEDQQQDVLVRWDSYRPVEKAIREQYEIDGESRRHILKAKSSDDLRSEEEKRQHSRFHKKMAEQGYTPTMVSRMLHHLSYAA